MKRHLLTLSLGFFLLFSTQPGYGQSEAASPLVDQTWVRLGGPIGGLGYDIRMHPENPDLMYVTDAWAGVHRSTDSGQTWVNSNNGIDLKQGPTADAIPVFCLTIDPNNPDTIWVGLQWLGGVYRSDDGGLTWRRRMNGMFMGQVGLTLRGFTVQPGNSDIVYAAGEVSSLIYAGYEIQGRGFEKVQGIVYRTTNGGESWEVIWRGPDLARYVIIHPDDPDILYVSTGLFDREAADSVSESNDPGGIGVIRSTDGGVTWEPMTNGLENPYIGTLFMKPDDPDTLLAGAGSNTYPAGGGVYVTHDGGETWTYKIGSHISSVEYSISNPEIAYAAGFNSFYRSEDGGDTWKPVNSHNEVDGWRWGPPGINVGFPIDMQVDPRDPNRIFINNYGGGNFLSEDGGVTWVSSSTGYTGAELTGVAIDPTNPAIVYTIGRSGPFRSTNGGRMWTGINVEEPLQAITEGAKIGVNPATPEQIIMSNAHEGKTYLGSSDGQSWIQVTNYWDELQAMPRDWGGAFHQGIQSLAYAPTEPDYVYGGMAVQNCMRWGEECQTSILHSLLISDDGGRNWKVMDGTALDGLSVSAIIVHPDNPGLAWAATMGQGVFVTFDGGETWEPHSTGLANQLVRTLALDPTNPDVLFAGTTGSSIYKSSDGGNTWTWSGTGIDFNEKIGAIVVDSVRPNVVYAGTWASGVYMSEDGGTTWAVHNEGLSTRAINAMAISKDGETLYAATRGEGLFRLSTLSQADFDALQPAPTPTTQPTAAPQPALTEVAEVDTSEQADQPEETSEPDSDGGGGGLCPASFAPLALVAAGIIIERRKRQ